MPQCYEEVDSDRRLFPPHVPELTPQAAKPVVLPFEQVARVDFELQPPPESNREVIVTGKMDIVSRVAFGHDWWAHPHFEMKHVHVGPYGKPNSPDADMGKVGHTSTSAQLIDYGSVVLNVDVFWQPDNSVKVNWFAAIFDGDDQKIHASENDHSIAPLATAYGVADLSTGGPWEDNAHIEFAITNAHQG